MSAQPCVIGGKLVVGTDTLDVLDPASGELLDRTVRGTADHIDAAVAAARAASKQWRRVSAADRSRTLRGIADLIRRNSDELAALESRDTGKPLSQARADAAVAARYFEYYAHTIEAFFGISLPANGGLLAYTKHEPFGVTGHIIPWNYPLQIACRTVAPAIAVGNCAVVKPAEEAPLSVIKLAQLALEAGLPPGVLNVVPGLGTEAGQALSAHPGIDHLSFTGSVEVGSIIAKAAAENVIPVALELGGKSPNVVFPDADLDAAIPTIVRSVIQNAGQTCSAGSRLLVHESVSDDVIAAIGQALSRVTIGIGIEDPDLGPLISAQQLDRVTTMVQRAERPGVDRFGGPGAIDVPGRGFFYPPTLLSGLTPSDEITREEVFGPVVAATTFASLDDAIALANATDYGLIAAVWTSSLDTAHIMADEIRAGQVFLNNYGAGGGVEYPFGGFKKSGYGREKGFAALAEFCQTKSVVLKLAEL
jgi:aldehyde dehydrogenase (NAD+)